MTSLIHAPVGEEFAADVVLADDITGFDPPADPAAVTDVLLTGATGFLGAFLLRELLAEGRTVHCLVRGRDDAAAGERLRANLATLRMLDEVDLDRVRVVRGDITAPRLGLTEAEHAELAAAVGAVYHSAAKVNFLTPYKWLRKATVDGVHEVLRLACAARAPLHHVSTTGVFEAAADRGARREDDLTGPPEALPLGYTKSKWVAERLVAEAGRRGVPVTVHRPGQVWGDSRTGACQRNDFVWRFIKGSVQAGVYPRNFRLSMNVVPIDYVGAAIAAICRRPGAIGGIYHQISPGPLDSAAILGLLRGAGYELREVSIIKWLKAIAADVENSMFPLMRTTMEMEGVESAEFSDAATRAFLAGSGITCPPIDQAQFDVYVDYFVRSGSLPAPTGPRVGA